MSARYTTNQRKHPRHRVLKEGQIVSAATAGNINVVVRDLSVGGARIVIPPLGEPPNKFDLFVPSENLFYPAIAKWRCGLMTGIAFAGEPYHSNVVNFNKPGRT